MEGLTSQDVIDRLGLEPLPGEGGWFRETFRADLVQGVGGAGGDAGRCFATEIYYLLRAGERSLLHRVRSTEVFHHYMGSAVRQVRFPPEGEAGDGETVVIGSALESGARPQVIVRPGWWQGAMVVGSDDADAFALMGCTVAPGFEWSEFELVDRAACDRLCERFPDHAEVIRMLGV